MPITINASTSSGLITTPDNSGAIALQNNGTTGLNIDASGRVTTPLQPKFLAYATGGGGNTFTGYYNYYLGTSYNVGSGFSTSTGTFTAPIAGYYMFYLQANSGSGTTSTPTRISVHKNNTFYPVNGAQTQIRAASNALTYTMSIVINMAVGDTARVYAMPGEGTMTDDGNYNYFGGYLLG